MYLLQQMDVIWTISFNKKKKTAEIEVRKHVLRPTSQTICICIVGRMFFHCHKFKTAWSALNDVCRRKFHGKGLKSNTLPYTYVFLLSSVVVRRCHTKRKLQGSIPIFLKLFFFSFFFSLFCFVCVFFFMLDIFSFSYFLLSLFFYFWPLASASQGSAIHVFLATYDLICLLPTN